jgi:hypothetical protein
MFPTVSLRALCDGRGRRVAQLLAVLLLLSVSDLGFTLWAHAVTPFDEMNPLARVLLDGNHVSALVVTKLLLTVTGIAIFWHLRALARAEVALWVLVAAYVTIALRWSEYTTHVIAANMLR